MTAAVCSVCGQATCGHIVWEDFSGSERAWFIGAWLLALVGAFALIIGCMALEYVSGVHWLAYIGIVMIIGAAFT